MAKSNGGTRDVSYPIPQTYKRIVEDTGYGVKYATKYVSKEDPSVEIIIERGSLSTNSPSGYTLKKDGKSDFSSRINSFLTLSEAKEMAIYYAKRGWK